MAILTTKEFDTEALIQKRGYTGYLVDELAPSASWSKIFLDLEQARRYAIGISREEPDAAVCIWEVEEGLTDYELLLHLYIDGEEWVKKDGLS